MDIGAIGNTQAATGSNPQDYQASPIAQQAKKPETSGVEFGSQSPESFNYEDIRQSQNNAFQNATKNWPDDLDTSS